MISYDEYLELARKDAIRNDYNLNGVEPMEDRFIVGWRTGGMAGGSCWGGADREIEPEPEADCVELMEFLDDLGLRLRQANEILKMAEHGSFSDRGYYGNHTDWGYKVLTLEALGEKLVEFGCVEPKIVPAP